MICLVTNGFGSTVLHENGMEYEINQLKKKNLSCRPVQSRGKRESNLMSKNYTLQLLNMHMISSA